MKHPLSRNKTSVKAIVWMVILTHLFWSQVLLAQGLGSVALVSNVTGKATLYHEGQTYLPEDARFKGPVVLGDRIQTGAQSMVAMLVGNDALVSLKEFSEMRVTEEPGFDQVIHVTTGQVCIATKRDGAPIKLEVPGATVTVNPGSMASIQVGTSDSRQGPSQTAEAPDYLHRTALGKQETLTNVSDQGTGKITVQLKEGSASLVSHIVGKAPVLLGAKQGVEVVGGIISPPFESKELYCQVQDLQHDPQHTAIPEETKDTIETDQQDQANQLVAFLGVGASYPDSVLPPNIPINNEVISTTDPDLSEGNENVPANPGVPLVQVGNSFLSVDSPFLVAIPSQTTVDGPPFQLNLNNFTGSTSEINPSQGLQGLSPQAASQLLAAFRDPNNPATLLAGLRVQSSPQGGAATVFGGLQLLNSQVQAPAEFIQIGQTDNPQTKVALKGALLNLEKNSTFTGEATLIALRNGFLDATDSSQPLVMVSGPTSSLTLINGASFLTTNPSMVMSPNGVLALTAGADVDIAGSLIELDGSTLDASGAQRALVTVENGSHLKVQGNLISAKNGSTLIAPSGVLSLNDGRADIENDFMSINASNVEANNGLVAATNNSPLIIDGYLLALSNGASVTINGIPGVTLADSSLQTNGLLKITNQPVPTALLAGLVDADAASTVTLTEAVVKVENTPGVTLASLVPLLPFGAPVALLAENSAVTVADYLSTNGVEPTPLVRLIASDLTATGLLRVTTPGAIPTALLSDLVNADAASTVTLTEAVVKVENTPGVTLASLAPLLPFGAPVALLAENSAVTVADYLATNTAAAVPVVQLVASDLTAQGLLRVTAPGAIPTALLSDLVNADAASTVTLTEAVVKVENTSGVTLASLTPLLPFGAPVALLAENSAVTVADYLSTNGVEPTPLVRLIASDLTAVGLLKVTTPGAIPTALLSDLVNADAASTVTLTEAVVKVENTPGVTLASLAPLLPFGAPVALLAENSAVTVADYLATNTAAAVPVVQLVASDLTAQGLLRVTAPGAIPTALLSDLVNADAASTVTLTEAVVKVENTSGVTLASLAPLLPFGAPVALLAENSAVTVADYLSTNGVEPTPLVRLIASDLTAVGLLKVTTPGAIPTALLSDLVNADAASTVTLTEAVVKVENTPGVTLASLAPLLPFGAPVALLAENSAVTVADYLATNTAAADAVVRLVASDLTAEGLLRVTTPGAIPTALLSDLVNADAASTVTLTEAVVKVENTSDVTLASLAPLFAFEAPVALLAENSAVTVADYLSTNGVEPTPLVRLIASDLTAVGLLKVTTPGAIPTALLSDLVNADAASTVTLTEAVVKVENTPGVTLASLAPLLPFGAPVALLAENSAVTVADYLSTNGVEPTPLVRLIASDLTAVGLLKVTTPGAIPTALLSDLVNADAASTVTLTEAVVKVENTSGVTLASLTPLFAFEAPVALLAENSAVTVADYLATNTAAAVLVVQLVASDLTAQGLLRVMAPGAVPTALLDGLVNADAASTVTLTEAVVKVENTPGATLASLAPLLALPEAAGVLALLAQNAQVTVAGDLVVADGTTVIVPVTGLAQATGGSILTVEGYVGAVSNNGQINVSGGAVPIVRLVGSTLMAEGLLKVTTPGQVPTGLLSGFVELDAASTVTLTEAVVKVENTPGVTLTSLTPLEGFGAVPLLAENSTVTITDYLAENGGGTTPVVRLVASALTAQGLLKVTAPGAVLTGLLSDLVDIIPGSSGSVPSTVTLTEAVVKVENTPGVTLTSLTPFLPFSTNLTPAGVVALMENSQVTVSGDLVMADGTNFTISGAGLLRATDSDVTVSNMGDLLNINDSDVNINAPILTSNASNVTADGGVLHIQDASSVIGTSTLGVLENNSFLKTTAALVTSDSVTSFWELAAPYFTVDESSIEANGGIWQSQDSCCLFTEGVLVTLTNSSDFTSEAALITASNSNRLDIPHPIISLDATSSLNAGGLLNVTNIQGAGTTEQVNITSELLSFPAGSIVNLTDALVRADASKLNFTVPALALDGQTLTAQGILHMQNNSTINNATPLVTLKNDSSLITTSLVSLQNQVDFPAGPLIEIEEGSSVTASDALVRVSDSGTLTEPIRFLGNFASLGVEFSSSYVTSSVGGLSRIMANGGILAVDNSHVSIEDTLLHFSTPSSSSDLPIPAPFTTGGLLSVANASSVMIGFNCDCSPAILNMDLDAEPTFLLSTATLVTVQESMLDIDFGTAFFINDSIGFFDEDDNFVHALTMTNGGLLDMSNSPGQDGEFGVDVGKLLSLSNSSLQASHTLVTVNNSSLHVGFNLLDINNQSQLTASGGLLSLQNMSTVVLGDDGEGSPGVNVNNSTLSVEATAIQVNGGSTLETAGRVFNLSGNSKLGGAFIDGKLLNATHPLLTMLNGTMTTSSGFLDVNGGSNMTVDIPNDALVSLDASALTINGSLVAVRGSGSAVALAGNLVSLTSGSGLTINNGFLVSALSGGTFTLVDGFLVNFGAGSNTLNISNVSANQINTQIPDLPVNLLGNATIGSTNQNNIRVAPNFDPFSVSGNPNAGSGAILQADGTSTICLGAACSAFPDPQTLQVD